MAVTMANMVRNLTLSLVARWEIGAVRASDQTLAINDGNGTSPVGDPSPAFKFVQRDCYAWSGSPEHHPEELVREGDCMVVEAIVSQKQPPSQPFLDLVASIGEGGVRHLGHERMRVLQHDLAQRGACLQRSPQMLR